MVEKILFDGATKAATKKIIETKMSDVKTGWGHRLANATTITRTHKSTLEDAVLGHRAGASDMAKSHAYNADPHSQTHAAHAPIIVARQQGPLQAATAPACTASSRAGAGIAMEAHSIQTRDSGLITRINTC